MTKSVDVFVVGAGPAGLAAGIVFARNGLKTLICEKRRLPVDKACGEGVLPPGEALLESLGVLKHIPPEDSFRIRGIHYRSPSGYEARADFKTGPALGVSRMVLSTAFRSRIEEIDHLEIREGVRVKALKRQADRISVETGDEVYSTRLVVGADGINSTVRRWAGLDGPAPALQRWGIRQHFSTQPWSDYVEVHWRSGVEAYITPCGIKKVGVAFLVDRNRFGKFCPGNRLLPSLVDSFPMIKEHLQGKDALDSPLAVGPMQRKVKATIADGVLLIGDAAGYIDAITGDGITLALSQAIALEQSAVPVMKKKEAEGNLIHARDLARYQQLHGSLVKPHNRMTKVALLLVRFPELVDPLTAFLNRNQKLFQQIISRSLVKL